MSKKTKKEVVDESKTSKQSKKSNGKKDKKKDGFGKKFVKFFKDCGKEIKRITWPTGMTVLKNTVVVLIVVALAGVIIYAFDFGMSSGLKAVKNAAENHTTTSAVSDDDSSTTTETDSETAE
jgi:preprotein translocase subunit SecE